MPSRTPEPRRSVAATRPGSPPTTPESAATGAVIVLLAGAAFFSGAALRICDALIPRLAHDFALSAGVSGRVVTGFAIGYGLMQLVFGPLGDRYGKTRLICIALAGCVVGALVSALAPGFDALIVARVAWGMAAAGVIPLAMAWIGDNVPYEQRQATLARFLTGTLTGMTAGQLAGGLFAESAVGWRGAFATLAVGYAAIATLIAVRAPRETRPARAGGHVHPPFARQLQAVLRVPWARTVLLTVAVEGVFLLAPMAYLPAYLQAYHGVRLSVASTLLALYAIGALTYAVLARRIVASLGERRMTLLGGLAMGACLLIWSWVPPWPAAGPLAFVLGFGTYLLHNTLQTHATQMVPAARGTAVSLFSFSLFGGQALGMVAWGAAIDRVGYLPMLAISGLALPITGWAFSAALRRRAARATVG